MMMNWSGNFRGAALTLILVVSCDYQNMPSYYGEKFRAFAPNDVVTKTYLADGTVVQWNSGDQISIFRSYSNEQYQFVGGEGASEGDFTKVDSKDVQRTLPITYAIYPFDENNAYLYDNRFSIRIPPTQHYCQNSFGKGSNIMAAVSTKDNPNNLFFYNVCGYIRLSVYGGDTIKQITLRTNAGEKISGNATLTIDEDSMSLRVNDTNSSDSITLDCGDGIKTGYSSNEPTYFYFVVPLVMR